MWLFCCICLSHAHLPGISQCTTKLIPPTLLSHQSPRTWLLPSEPWSSYKLKMEPTWKQRIGVDQGTPEAQTTAEQPRTALSWEPELYFSPGKCWLQQKRTFYELQFIWKLFPTFLANMSPVPTSLCVLWGWEPCLLHRFPSYLSTACGWCFAWKGSNECNLLVEEQTTTTHDECS